MLTFMTTSQNLGKSIDGLCRFPEQRGIIRLKACPTRLPRGRPQRESHFYRKKRLPLHYQSDTLNMLFF
ncbi:hypothetical protein [uncultured Mailhella sp.]|uniref:hypothetical protein n=1 Tax=uncultured Mailhella sp. TaxID=1981031 RepID=UPI0025FCFE67|nr:hypothetical protein [uncultured Mailhella sp.]